MGITQGREGKEQEKDGKEQEKEGKEQEKEGKEQEKEGKVGIYPLTRSEPDIVRKLMSSWRTAEQTADISHFIMVQQLKLKLHVAHEMVFGLSLKLTVVIGLPVVIG